jgi:hypothetical protein
MTLPNGKAKNPGISFERHKRVIGVTPITFQKVALMISAKMFMALGLN